jgi:hypothetical protein
MKKIAFIIPTLLLFGSLMEGLPYAYFKILRVVVSVSSIYIAIMVNETKYKWGVWVFVSLAFLFNPIMPIYLSRSTWTLIDMISGVIFIVFGLLMHNKRFVCMFSRK